jgi:hypothetical protein
LGIVELIMEKEMSLTDFTCSRQCMVM